jgi:hypothetical protein
MAFLNVAEAATASTLAKRNASGEVIAANTVPTGKTAMATDTPVAAAQLTTGSAVVCQKFFGTAAPGSVTGNLPGDLYSDTTAHNIYQCNAASGTSAPACTSVTAGGWTLLNAAGSSTSIHSFNLPGTTGNNTGIGYGSGNTGCFGFWLPNNGTFGKIAVYIGTADASNNYGFAVYDSAGDRKLTMTPAPIAATGFQIINFSGAVALTAGKYAMCGSSETATTAQVAIMATATATAYIPFALHSTVASVLPATISFPADSYARLGANGEWWFALLP